MPVSFHATTICAVRHNGHTAMAGDGQVTMGEKVIMKNTAHKVRRIYNGQVVVGFAGSVADAFKLEERFEMNLVVTYKEQPSNWLKNGVVTKLYKN